MRDSLPLLTRTVSHLTLCDFLHQSVDVDDEEALQRFEKRVEAKEDVVDVMNLLVSTFSSLTSSQEAINRHLPGDVEVVTRAFVQRSFPSPRGSSTLRSSAQSRL